MPEAIPEKCLSKPWFESMDLLNGEPAPGPWKKIWGYGCDHPLDCENYMSMDWFKGKNTGEPHISWENRWFPLKILPSSNSLAQGKTL